MVVYLWSMLFNSWNTSPLSPCIYPLTMLQNGKNILCSIGILCVTFITFIPSSQHGILVTWQFFPGRFPVQPSAANGRERICFFAVHNDVHPWTRTALMIKKSWKVSYSAKTKYIVFHGIFIFTNEIMGNLIVHTLRSWIRGHVRLVFQRVKVQPVRLITRKLERLVVRGRLGDLFIDKGVSRFKKIWN